jgi:hypothetical protein
MCLAAGTVAGMGRQTLACALGVKVRQHIFTANGSLSENFPLF